MNDEKEWASNIDDLITEVCEAWRLPLPPARSARSRPAREPLEKNQAAFPEEEVKHENDSMWQASGERFVFVMDSQVVQRVACGHAALANEKYRCIFRRVVQKFVRFIDDGLMPPTDIADPVQWRPREYNTKADWLCNHALNTASSFEFLEDCLEPYWAKGLHWEAFSDGACRNDGHSAFAWIIYATWTVSKQRHCFTVAFGYELVDGNHSSFATELWGLERAVLTMEAIFAKTKILRNEPAD